MAVLEKPKVLLVLVGRFDPAEVLPSKLGDAGVVRPEEAAAAQIKVLLPGQVAEYSLGWCSLAVVRERFVVETTTPPFVRIADLVQKTLIDLMPHAVVSQLGINRVYTIRFESQAERDAFGTRLAPPSAWGPWGSSIEHSMNEPTVKVHGGLVSITMRERPVAGREHGWRDVQVTAGATSEVTPMEAMINVNDHFFAAGDTDQPAGLEPEELAQRRTSALMRTLYEQFDASLNTQEDLAQSIIASTR